jgi:hypothetical protein
MGKRIGGIDETSISELWRLRGNSVVAVLDLVSHQSFVGGAYRLS